jgi:hypothetical protein
VRWSFRVTRGKLPVEVLAAVDRDDVVVTEALRLRAARSMQVAVEVPRIAPLQSRRAAELIRETRRQASRALVLSPGSLPDAGEQVRVLLEQMSCPIVLTL